MRGKLLFITGGLVGYVLGARAGRKRYDQIAAAANDFWNAKPVQRRVSEVRDFALDAVGDAPVALFNAGKKAVSAMQAKKADAAAPAKKTGSTSPTSSSANGTPASTKPASKPGKPAAASGPADDAK
ncbi:YtxH domain-containing protein [Glaciibacter sp. 2TAF33]|uniref:YtxH domain-containing protein n=1 Tax=Glaciibacter sp. 2TAF33 TaxID=3233015 RepID=UPI003F91A9EA